jgi:hypothetical protein
LNAKAVPNSNPISPGRNLSEELPLSENRLVENRIVDVKKETNTPNGRPEQLHIPKDKEEMVREWVENYHQVQELIENISSSYWDRLKRKG